MTPGDSTRADEVRAERWRALGFAQPPTAAAPRSAEEDRRLAEAEVRIPTAVDVAARGVHSGIHAGMSFYVSRGGEPVAEAAVGWAGPEQPMTSRTMIPWFCCMKPLYALGFGLLWEAGEIDPRQPIADVVPEFGTRGKERLTFRHLLTHTSGLRPEPVYRALWKPREEVLDAIFAAELPADAVPGAEAYYGQFWAWIVLAEAFDRILGHDHRRLLRDSVLTPLGADDCLLTVTDDDWTRDGDRIGAIYDTASSQAPQRFAATEHRWQYETFGPGIIGVGSAGALGRVGEAFLPHPPRPILQPQTVAALTARHRVGLWDEHWSGFVSWGLGIIVDGWMFGSRCSPETAGHIGYNTTFFSVDPVAEVVVAGAANGLCATGPSAARDQGFSDGAHVDLGAGSPVVAPRVVAVDPPCRTESAATQAREEARYWNPASGSIPASRS